MKEQPFDPRDYEAFVREVDDANYNDLFSANKVLPRGVIPKRRSMNMAQSLSSHGNLWMSGIPFVLPAGDGSTNGLSFTGTRGVFTLSAAILSGVSAMLTGCYLYLPAGAGGLAAAGWYWATFADDTNGEVFANTYTPGAGTPPLITSPTPHPNLTSGRITQTTNEITAVSFVMPGGSLGPNGLARMYWKQLATSSGNTKSVRYKAGSTIIAHTDITTSYLDSDIETSVQNSGTVGKQIRSRPNGPLGMSFLSYGIDHTAVDTAIDQTITGTMKLNANTDHLVAIFRSFIVTYGA